MKHLFISILTCISQLALCQLNVFPSVVERGRHVLVQATDEVQDIQITDQNGNLLPLERVTKLNQNSIVFMVPYNAPDGTYSINAQTDLHIEGDLSRYALDWFCGHLGNQEESWQLNTGVTKPNCVEPGENVDGLWDAQPLPDFNSDVWTGNLTGFVGGIEVTLTGSVNEIEHASNDGRLAENSFTMPTSIQGLNVPNGINEVFIISSRGIFTVLVNILGDVEADTVVVTSDNVDPDVSGVLSQIANDPDVNNLIKLGGSTGLCAGALSIFSPSPQPGASNTGLGHKIEEVRRQLIEAQRDGRIDANINYYVDPNPKPKTCTIAYPDSFQSTNTQNTVLQQINPVTIAILDTGFAWASTSQDEFNSNRVYGFKDFVEPNNPTQKDVFYTPDLDGNGTLDVNEVPITISVIDSSNTQSDITLNRDPNGNYIPSINVGHGTGVAILAAGSKSNDNPNAYVMPIRVCDETGNCKGSTFIEGICYALNNEGSIFDRSAKPENLVINMSIGGTIPMSALERVLRDATSLGTTIIAAAGNDAYPECMGGNCPGPQPYSAQCNDRGRCDPGIEEDFITVNSQPHYPAAYALRNNTGILGVLAVGAYSNQQPRSYSNRGSYVTLTAPDDAALSGADLVGFQTIPGISNPARPILFNGYYKGTSFSTPLVAGTIASIKESGADNQKIYDCLVTPNVLDSFSSINPSDAMAVGFGLLNVANLKGCTGTAQ